MKAIKMIVFGKVQNVGYRDSIVEHIKKNAINVKGYVKNLPDKCVEIVAIGPEKELEKLEYYAYIGAQRSKVEKIEMSTLNDAGIKFDTFKIEY